MYTVDTLDIFDAMHKSGLILGIIFRHIFLRNTKRKVIVFKEKRMNRNTQCVLNGSLFDFILWVRFSGNGSGMSVI